MSARETEKDAVRKSLSTPTEALLPKPNNPHAEIDDLLGEPTMTDFGRRVIADRAERDSNKQAAVDRASKRSL